MVGAASREVVLMRSFLVWTKVTFGDVGMKASAVVTVAIARSFEKRAILLCYVVGSVF